LSKLSQGKESPGKEREKNEKKGGASSKKKTKGKREKKQGTKAPISLSAN